MTRILIVNGHPDPRPATFCAALAAAYAAGAAAGGHEVRRIDIGTLDLPIIHNAAEFGAPASHPRRARGAAGHRLVPASGDRPSAVARLGSRRC